MTPGNRPYPPGAINLRSARYTGPVLALSGSSNSISVSLILKPIVLIPPRQAGIPNLRVEGISKLQGFRSLRESLRLRLRMTKTLLHMAIKPDEWSASNQSYPHSPPPESSDRSALPHWPWPNPGSPGRRA